MLVFGYLIVNGAGKLNERLDSSQKRKISISDTDITDLPGVAVPNQEPQLTADPQVATKNRKAV